MASVIFMLYAAETWGAAILCAVVFCLAVYPILCLIEKWRGYTNLFIERKPGEVKKSLFLLFGTHTAIAALSCGLLGKPYITVAAILMWGIGDTAAALVGKKYDTHHIQLKRADPHTSSLHNRLFWCHYSSKFHTNRCYQKSLLPEFLLHQQTVPSKPQICLATFCNTVFRR